MAKRLLENEMEDFAELDLASEGITVETVRMFLIGAY